MYSDLYNIHSDNWDHAILVVNRGKYLYCHTHRTYFCVLLISAGFQPELSYVVVKQLMSEVELQGKTLSSVLPELLRQVQPDVVLTQRVDSLKRHVVRRLAAAEAGQLPEGSLLEEVELLSNTEETSGVSIIEEQCSSGATLTNAMFLSMVKSLRKRSETWGSIAHRISQLTRSSKTMDKSAFRKKLQWSAEQKVCMCGWS